MHTFGYVATKWMGLFSFQRGFVGKGAFIFQRQRRNRSNIGQRLNDNSARRVDIYNLVVSLILAAKSRAWVSATVAKVYVIVAGALAFDLLIHLHLHLGSKCLKKLRG